MTVKYGSKEYNLNSHLSGYASEFFLDVRFRNCLYLRSASMLWLLLHTDKKNVWALLGAICFTKCS